MTAAEIQNAIIPKLKVHTGRVLVEADQAGELPEDAHMVFKITVPFAKGTGRPEVTHKTTSSVFKKHQTEEYRLTFSFTAVSEDGDTSMELAQSARDWFDFYGYEELSALDIVIVTLGDIGNRDSVIDEEARRGFDVILRTTRELSASTGYYNKVETSRE